MRELERPVRRVWRRLRVQRFLTALVWAWGLALGLAAVAIGVEKLGYPIPGQPWWALAAAGGVGLVVAALTTLLSGPGRLDAAVAIDRAFHLNERISTALTLPDDLRATPAGQALLADAARHARDLDLGAHFGLRVPRRAWVPLVPAALALGLLFVPDWTRSIARAKSSAVEKVDKEAVAKKAAELQKRIAKQRQALDKTKFTEAEKLLAEIEKATRELAKAPPAQKDKALIQLNQLSDALKDRQKQLGSPEQINRQLQQLKQMATSGPADEFAKDLAKGDFQKAADELKKLQDKLISGKMTEAEKKALRQQLGEMKQQLEKLANLDERKRQLEEARKNGGLSQKQFEQEMAKLHEQSRKLKQLQQMAQQLGQAQQQMEKGNMQKAAEALGMSRQELSQMAQQLQELQALDGALAELQDAKNGMTGEGMNQLGMGLDGMNQFGNGMDGRGKAGMGLGRGRGRGDRPEAPDATAAYNTKVKQQYTKGKAVLEGFAPPNAQARGESLLGAVETIEAGEGLNAEALSNQKIPRGIQKHILNYYDKINKAGK